MAPRGSKKNALSAVDANAPPPMTPRRGAEIASLKEENESLKSEMALLSASLAATQISAAAAPAPAPAAPARAAAVPVVAPPRLELIPLPAAPAKALSAYSLFCASERPKLAGMKLPEQARALAASWKALKGDERAVFEATAGEGKAKYDESKKKHDREVAKVEQERMALTRMYEAKQQQVAVEYYRQVLTGTAPAAGPVVKTEEVVKGETLVAPKKPKTAYHMFMADRRATLMAKKEKAGEEKKLNKEANEEMMKTWGEEWTKLQKTKAGQKKIAKFQALHEAGKKSYAVELKIFEEKVAAEKAAGHAAAVRELEEDKKAALAMYLPVLKKEEADKASQAAQKENKKAKKAQRALEPKRGKSAYIFFSLAAREKVVKEMPEATPAIIMAECGKRWKEASDEAKAPFVAAAAADKVRFTEEMAAYQKTAGAVAKKA